MAFLFYFSKYIQDMSFKEAHYSYQGPFTIAELAEFIGCETKGETSTKITDLSPLSAATTGHMTFFDNPKYLEQMKRTNASACILHPRYTDVAPQGMTLLVSPEPYRAYARIAQKFYVPLTDEEAIHPSAVIHPSARIGEGCRIGANVVIGRSVEIGEGTKIYSGVSIQSARIGKNCIIHAGARIGQDGFGFAMGMGEHVKVPQLGGVIIGDNVEIGANSCVDRGSGPDTVIGDNTKIDNLVQIGHNVEIGKNCVIVSQVGIAGSTKVGDYTVIGGQAGISGHVKVGSGVRIAAGTGVIKNVESGKTVGGAPAMDIRDWHKSTLAIQKLIRGKDDN